MWRRPVSQQTESQSGDLDQKPGEPFAHFRHLRHLSDGCPGPCENRALRGARPELLYPMPFGKVTAGSEKDYPLDFSHFNVMAPAWGPGGSRPTRIRPFFRLSG